ncbi:MAG: DUF5123 domain-containing protein [Lentisphaerae bacterium]|nr:DUF5123 domain-containing protein [Lentisphaerota bacterium]
MKSSLRLTDSRRIVWLDLEAVRGALARSVLKLAILGLCFAPGALLAATFYVRTDGNDANSGTANSPSGAWRTIQKAAISMAAGDAAIVANGNYPETVTTGANGTPNSRITFRAQSTNVVVTSFIVNKAYNTIEGFTVTGESPSIDASLLVNTGGDYVNVISNVFQGSRIGVYQLYAYIYATNIKNITASGNKFLNGWGHSVVLASGGGHVISNNVFSNPNGYDAIRVFSTNITIVANTFTNWESKPLTSGPLKVGATYYFLSLGSPAEMDWSNVGCRKYYQLGSNYTFTATGTTPKSWGNAVIASAGNQLLYAGVKNPPLVVGKKYYFDFIYLPQWDDFSNVQDSPTRLTGIGNCWTATGTTPTAWGYAVLGAGSNIILTNGQSLVVGQKYYFISGDGNPNFDNVGAQPLSSYLAGEAYYFTATNTTPISWGAGTVVDNANHPDIIQSFQNGAVGTVPPDYPAWDLVFERNLVVDCGVQLGNVTDDGSFGNIKRWTFRNNLFVRVSNALNLYAPGFSFYNNTFYRCAAVSGMVVIWGVSGAGTARDLTVYNNIIAECGVPTRANSGWYGGDAAANQVMDYNLVVGTGTGTTKSGFNEVHGINGRDPLFVNPVAGDFRLQASSPCRGTATNLSSRFTTDFNGTKRGTVWDMGAFAFVGTNEAPVIGPSAPENVRQVGVTP